MATQSTKMGPIVLFFCLCMCGTGILADDSTSLDHLLGRIEALESQGRILQRQNVQHNKLLQIYEDRMAQYEIEKEITSYQIKELERRLSESELKHSHGVGQGDVRLHNVSALVKGRRRPRVPKARNRRSHDKTRRLVLNDPEVAIAFHATSDNGVTSNIGENQHIQFEDVHLNIGGGYHVQHGLFIAPVAGIYMFSTSIMATAGGSDIIASIIKDGTNLAKAYAFGGVNYDQGSVSVVTQLAAGDEVWVASVQRPSVSEYGDMFTSFMGCLLS